MVVSQSTWRKDAKWVCAITLTLALTAALTLGGFYRVNAPDPARNLLKTLILTSSLAADIEAMYDNVRKTAEDSPEELQQINAILFDVNLSKNDILHSTPDQFKKKIADEIARQVYKGQVVRGSSAKKSPFFGMIIIFTFFLSEPAHQATGALTAIFTVITIVFGLLVISFSTRFGKVASMGLVIIFSSLPNIILFSMIGKFAELTSPALLGSLPIGESFAEAATVGLSQSELFLIFGLVLLAAGIIGGSILRLREKEEKKDFL